MSQPGAIQADQLLVILEKVSSRLKSSSGGSGTRQPKVFDALEDVDVRNLFTQLKDVLATWVSASSLQEEKISTLETSCEAVSHQVTLSNEKIVSLEKSSRTLSDLNDHHHQRSLKGKFSIFPLNSDCLVQKEDFEKDGKRLSFYVCELIYQKYSFETDESDISSCHFSKKGISFRLLNLSPTSTYGLLVKAITHGQGSKERGIFFNFALTPKRASLLFELRQAKRAKKIDKLYSDSDGSISYVSPSSPNNSRGKKEKTRISSIFNRVEGEVVIRTHSIQELKEELDSIQLHDSSL